MTAEIPSDIEELVRFCLAEDIGSGDITAELIPEHTQLTAMIVCKDTGIFCGTPWAIEVLKQVDGTVSIEWSIEEGAALEEGQCVARLSGSARSILTAERTLLNFLQTLSAVATSSHRYAQLVKHTAVSLLDTRKTLPGLRSAQKYAVRIGGCFNHRMGLFDAFLIKENHIAACGGIVPAIGEAKSLHPNKPVEIEVQNLDEMQQAIDGGADTIMLDNFDLEAIKKAVKLNASRVKLEASGGIEAQTLVSIAETGVDYISLGALTKHVKAIDLSLLVE